MASSNRQKQKQNENKSKLMFYCFSSKKWKKDCGNYKKLSGFKLNLGPRYFGKVLDNAITKMKNKIQSKLIH